MATQCTSPTTLYSAPAPLAGQAPTAASWCVSHTTAPRPKHATNLQPTAPSRSLAFMATLRLACACVAQGGRVLTARRQCTLCAAASMAYGAPRHPPACATRAGQAQSATLRCPPPSSPPQTASWAPSKPPPAPVTPCGQTAPATPACAGMATWRTAQAAALVPPVPARATGLALAAPFTSVAHAPSRAPSLVPPWYANVSERRSPCSPLVGSATTGEPWLCL